LVDNWTDAVQGYHIYSLPVLPPVTYTQFPFPSSPHSYHTPQFPYYPHLHSYLCTSWFVLVLRVGSGSWFPPQHTYLPIWLRLHTPHAHLPHTHTYTHTAATHACRATTTPSPTLQVPTTAAPHAYALPYCIRLRYAALTAVVVCMYTGCRDAQRAACAYHAAYHHAGLYARVRHAGYCTHLPLYLPYFDAWFTATRGFCHRGYAYPLLLRTTPRFCAHAARPRLRWVHTTGCFTLTVLPLHTRFLFGHLHTHGYLLLHTFTVVRLHRFTVPGWTFGWLVPRVTVVIYTWLVVFTVLRLPGHLDVTFPVGYGPRLLAVGYPHMPVRHTHRCRYTPHAQTRTTQRALLRLPRTPAPAYRYLYVCTDTVVCLRVLCVHIAARGDLPPRPRRVYFGLHHLLHLSPLRTLRDHTPAAHAHFRTHRLPALRFALRGSLCTLRLRACAYGSPPLHRTRYTAAQRVLPRAPGLRSCRGFCALLPGCHTRTLLPAHTTTCCAVLCVLAAHCHACHNACTRHAADYTVRLPYLPADGRTGWFTHTHLSYMFTAARATPAATPFRTTFATAPHRTTPHLHTTYRLHAPPAFHPTAALYTTAPLRTAPRRTCYACRCTPRTALLCRFDATRHRYAPLVTAHTTHTLPHTHMHGLPHTHTRTPVTFICRLHFGYVTRTHTVGYAATHTTFAYVRFGRFVYGLLVVGYVTVTTLGSYVPVVWIHITVGYMVGWFTAGWIRCALHTFATDVVARLPVGWFTVVTLLFRLLCRWLTFGYGCPLPFPTHCPGRTLHSCPLRTLYGCWVIWLLVTLPLLRLLVGSVGRLRYCVRWVVTFGRGLTLPVGWLRWRWL